MSSKSKSRNDEALQLLDDLDSFAPPAGANPAATKGTPPPPGNNEGEAAEALAFLEEITQKSSEPARATPVHISRSGTPTIRKSTERVRLGGGAPTSLLPSASSSSSSLHKFVSAGSDAGAKKIEQQQQAGGAGVGGWGWGSVWSTASAAIQQAKTVVDEQVKQLPKNEQARKWGEGVIEYAKSAQLDKLGQDFKRVGLSTLTDILNVVAPPISEHEVIQVWLSHDMEGYEGVESLVYRALARIMEQVEGGDLIVNRGNESRPKDGSGNGRNLNTVEGYDAAIKLTQANIAEIIKTNAQATQPKASITTSPTTYSHVYLRIQPYFTTYGQPMPLSPSADSDASSPLAIDQQHLQFLVYLFDPEHKLTHMTVTQAVPGKWLAVWDEYEWVEDLVAEALRVGVEVIGQEYVVARMGWGEKGVDEESAKGEGEMKKESGEAKEATVVDTGEKVGKDEEP